MRFIVDHDLHIHSNLSTCSRCPEQTPERIAQYAVEEGLKTICLTNHFWDETIPGASNWYMPQDYPHIASAKPLPQPEGIRFLFGCETELDQNLTLGISRERMALMDFIIIPTTHFHMNFALTEAQRQDRVGAWLCRLGAVLDMDLPFHKVGLAHLTCTLINRDREEYLKILAALPEKEMTALFQKAAKLGVGLAIENMFIHTNSCPACFAASADDLVELVDKLGDDKVFGLCWDTGHGNLNKVDQVQALHTMGKRLKALHVNDNKGVWDDHILPFHGTIAWIPFMKALGEIGYEGDFTYEIHNFSMGFDPGFHHRAIKFAREIGQDMVSLM
jgi:sugar phosphate isomerase/epimerase